MSVISLRPLDCLIAAALLLAATGALAKPPLYVRFVRLRIGRSPAELVPRTRANRATDAAASQLRSAETAATGHFDSLSSKIHRGLHRLLHRAAMSVQTSRGRYGSANDPVLPETP